MKTYVWIFALLLLFGCDNASQVAAPKDPPKIMPRTCASADYYFKAIGSRAILVDTLVAPPDTTSFGEGYFREAARSCDAVYLGGMYSGLVVMDISDPKNPQLSAILKSEMTFHHLHISDDRLIADWEVCDDHNGGYADCIFGGAEWNISDPLNPVLTKLTIDPPTK